MKWNEKQRCVEQTFQSIRRKKILTKKLQCLYLKGGRIKKNLLLFAHEKGLNRKSEVKKIEFKTSKISLRLIQTSINGKREKMQIKKRTRSIQIPRV